MAERDDLARTLREQVPAVLQVIQGSSIEEVRLDRDGASVMVRRTLAEGAATDEHAGHIDNGAVVEAAAAELARLSVAGRTEVRAPVVGIFHRSREADGPLLATEGDRVDGGKVLGVIETLGIGNDVMAPVGGRLAEMLVPDGHPVEYGELIAVIVPE